MHRGRLLELDGIRGIACILVLLDHVIFSNLPSLPGIGRLTPWLIGGVDLFFVLSGFLIGGILIDNKLASNYFKVFWIRRAGRVWPVYYLLVLTFFAVLALKPYLSAPWLDRFLLRDTMPLWTYPLFLQNFAQASDNWFGGARWVASTWSLAIEEQFYLLAPPLVYLMTRRSITSLAVTCIVAALLFRALLSQMTGSWTAGYFLLPGRMDSLAFGLLGALAVRNASVLAWMQRTRRWLDAMAVLTVLFLTANGLQHAAAAVPREAAFVVENLDFTLRSALFAYVIVRVFVVPEASWYRRALSTPVLVFSGGISYALYMYHPAINGLLHGIAFADEPKLPDIQHYLVALAVIVVSVMLAWLSTRYVERPIRRWSQRASYKNESFPRDSPAHLVAAGSGAPLRASPGKRDAA